MTEKCHLISVKNAEAAQWLIDSIEEPWGRAKNANYAAAVIPRGFAAYVRLFHPAYLRNENREITWSEIAKYSGRKPHAQMQWPSIVNFSNLDICLTNLTEPDTGRLPERQAKALVEILCKYTNTLKNCYFAIWDGWGLPSLEKLRNQTACFQLWDRRYYLMKGDIYAATSHMSYLSRQTASIWWPEDRAWCVATEIDMMWTYIGGDRALH